MISLPRYMLHYDVGARVLIGDDMLATVTAILIESGTRVTYRCVWWDGPDHVSDWFESYEIQPFQEV